MIAPIKLNASNIAGCNGIQKDGKTIVGLIRFDKEGPVHADSGIILEFPNRKAVELAIERLQELRERQKPRITLPFLAHEAPAGGAGYTGGGVNHTFV